MKKAIILSLAALVASAAIAQGLPGPVEKRIARNAVSISTEASIEVPQDWISISMTATEQAPDPQTVKRRLTESTNAAIVVIKEASGSPAKSGEITMRFRTKRFDIIPTYGRDSKINGWTGRSEVVIEGHDFTLIAETAGKIKTMQASNSMYTVSPTEQARHDAKLRTMAIEKFRDYASGTAKDFGFKSYSIGEVNISNQSQFLPPMLSKMSMMRMDATAAAAPIPVEPGVSTMRVVVSGSILLEN